MVRKLILSVSVFTLISSATVAHADDQVKNLLGSLAVGIVGKVMEDAAKEKQSNDTQEQVTWNDPEPKVIRHPDETTRDVQRRLKGQGFYKSTVDGLTGKGTTAAIKAWEEHHGLTVDGEMSYKEYALLKAIDSGDPHEIYELKNELRGGYPNGIDYADAYNAEPVKASNVAKVSVSQADIDEWGHEYSKVMNYAFLLKACRELKETFLTTYYTNKGLGRAETFIKDLRATIQRRLECKGYGEDNIAAVYDRGKAIALDSEEAEKLDVLMQMVQMEDEDAADSLAMQCGNLVDNDAAGYLKIKDALQFNEKVCAYEIPESAGLGYSIR